MRILHTSDWHLGNTLCGVSMIKEQCAMTDALLKTVEYENIEAVIIAGDVFDHAVASTEAISLYDNVMTELCHKMGVPVLICAGNHDGAARLSACGELLAESGLHIAGKLQKAVDPICIGEAAFFLIPWFNADEARLLYPKNDIDSYEKAMLAVISAIRENGEFLPERKNILVAHCFASGALTGESDRAAAVGGAAQVGLPTFEGFDYVALGHLHRAQQLSAHIRYSGTPLSYAFSEATAEKSFTVLDTDTMEITEIPIPQTRPLRILTGKFEKIMDVAANDEKADDYLKIELLDRVAGAETFSILRERYPNLLQLTGITAEVMENAGSLTVKELAELTPRGLFTRFYEEIASGYPDVQERLWFDEAAVQAEEEGDLQ